MKICPVCDKEYPDDHINCVDDGARLISLPSGPDMTIDPLVGRMFTDRYKIEARIGVGGMGSVYRGVDTTLGRKVAIKVLLKDLRHDAEQVKRFFNEAKVVARLRHQNTIQVFDFGESTDGQYYIAMEYMTGEPLDVHLQKHELTLLRVLEILDQICQSLDEAHAAGIIHRDLKPDNIFIDTVNGNRVVKVIDFGIAKMVSGGENLTKAGMVFGTPAYMAPEQAKGEQLDPRSDIYSLGVVLYFLLTGEPIFTGENPMEIAIKHITTPHPSVQAHSRLGVLPQALVDLVDSMLSKDREHRPASAAAVRAGLQQIREQVLAGGPGSLTTRLLPTGHRPTPGDGLPLPVDAPRSRAPMVTGIIALLLIGAGVIFTLTRPDATTVEPTPGSGTSPQVEAPAEGTTVVEVDAAPLPPTPEELLADVMQHTAAALTSAQAATARLPITNITVTSTPDGATVTRTDTGAVLGETPCTLTVLRDGAEIPLHFEMEGYESADATVARTESSHVQSLERIATERRTPQRNSQGRNGGIRLPDRLRRPVTIVD